MSTHQAPTKRELREQRRAERLAAERADAARATLRTRAWRLAAAAGVAAVLVAVAVIASSSGGKPATSSPAASADAAALFQGIPEHKGVLGDPTAPVTVTEYVDLQCPICAAVSKSTLPALVRDYVRTGKVKLEARALHFIGPDSQRAARVAAGAAEQNRLWPFLETFYAAQGEENSGYVTDAFLRSVSGAAGVNANTALAQADGSAAQAALDLADADAQRLGIDSTPTFTVVRGTGKPQVLSAQDVLGALSRATA